MSLALFYETGDGITKKSIVYIIDFVDSLNYFTGSICSFFKLEKFDPVPIEQENFEYLYDLTIEKNDFYVKIFSGINHVKDFLNEKIKPWYNGGKL